MSAHRLLFIVLMGLLAMQLAATHPLLSFSTLFVSEEDEGLVRNLEYVDRLHSSEEVSTKTGDSICDNYMIHMTPKIMADTYETFAKVLVRDSREVTKQKLREVKSTYSDKETSIGYFFLMMRTFSKVNVTWEGELIYFTLWEMVEKAENYENDERKTTWLDQLFERIRCTVLTADLQRDKSNLINQISIEKEISEHFDVFKQFWLAYAKTKRPRRDTNTTNSAKKRRNEDFSCVIGILESPLLTANITFSVFAMVLTRDSQIVIEKKLQESQSVNMTEVTDLSKMLRHIKSFEMLDASLQGKFMYRKLQSINRERDEDSMWQNNILDRIFCYAQKVRTERDFSDLVETITMADTIEEHFDVFKQFWLNYPASHYNDHLTF